MMMNIENKLLAHVRRLPLAWRGLSIRCLRRASKQHVAKTEIALTAPKWSKPNLMKHHV